ncbi:Transcriptional regulator, MerR family [Olavius algarvensis associated proteobacterium Delta 3]|nr:Transcriptional regulator, MerR family [Olavius algarvensis associated proteobacterium Delta 3]CAB5163408.1 Transcriptional regulator, MerR family [Olavius algarvensis associated proteobacterium Delta 3]
MFKNKIRVSSGVRQLDRLLGGLFIGDNVVWYDDAGSLAAVFSFNFIQESQEQQKPLIYFSFDRSPKTIIEELGPLAESRYLTILDCFTHGKGDGSEIFSNFYEKNGAKWPYQIIMVKEPWKPEKVAESIYTVHGAMKSDVRFVFESLTGMQDLWGGEEQILKFYTRSCPRLYELETIAYWIMEKGAHSDRLKANINQIAQVAIDLSIKRGKSALTILKADKRKPDTLNIPNNYWDDGMTVSFESESHRMGKIDLGMRLRDLRTRQGLSQKELAGLIGVTPSTISQIESNTIYPSLPALFKIAQMLNVSIGSLFKDMPETAIQVVFSGRGTRVSFPYLPKGTLTGYRLSPADFDAKAEPYIIEIGPDEKISSHFFIHKGEEMGYVLSGKLAFKIRNAVHTATAGDLIYLTSDMPSEWKNVGEETCRLLWISIK